MSSNRINGPTIHEKNPSIRMNTSVKLMMLEGKDWDLITGVYLGILKSSTYKIFFFYKTQTIDGIF